MNPSKLRYILLYVYRKQYKKARYLRKMNRAWRRIDTRGIVDLCIVREKNPQIGTWKLENAKVVGDNFYLNITDGKEAFTLAIETPNEDGMTENERSD